MTKAFALLLVVTTAIAAGCGASERDAVAAKPRASKRTCDPTPVRGFRTCLNATTPVRPSIERWTGSDWEVLTGPLPNREPTASWRVVALSPDRSTLLAEWSYPCDSAAVVFVPVGGGSPRIATGEKDWLRAPVAQALGWTRDGKARVRLYSSWHGHRITPQHPRAVLLDPKAPPRNDPEPLGGC